MRKSQIINWKIIKVIEIRKKSKSSLSASFVLAEVLQVRKAT